MISETLVTILVSAGGGTILAALVNALFNRRKLSAEATQIITQAAAGTVENVMKDNTALRARLAEVEAKILVLENAQAAADQRERAHLLSEERWIWHMGRWHRHSDRQAAQLRAANIDAEDPPPLWPDPITAADLK